jgi:ubiquinone/menaquinone biosynthesis C-methylase UbiE
MSELAYHMLELEIARARDDPRRVAPVLINRCESVLDIGCGAGQTLIACEVTPTTFTCGVDIDQEALALGRRLSQQIAFVRASGERLPFSDGSFDVVISRVSLPYMRLPVALREIARVLKPGGQVWLTLHPISITIEGVARSLKERNAKNLAHQLYVIVNGLLFHFTGRQFSSPFNRAKCESFQTTRGIVRAMRAAGFDQVRPDHRGRIFVVTASASLATARGADSG